MKITLYLDFYSGPKHLSCNLAYRPFYFSPLQAFYEKKINPLYSYNMQ
jgi:hypothetical protein